MSVLRWARDHQKQTLDKMSRTPVLFDASDPGTGKTYCQIAAFVLRRIKGGKKALILAPRSLLRSAWELDFKKFSPSTRCSIARASNRAKAFALSADVYITNHDAVKWLVKQPPEFFAQFDTIILDESGAFKHHTSGRSKALAKIIKHFRYRSALNGTPNPVSITDIWHQIKLLDDGARLSSSFFAFRQSVCTPKQVGPSAQMIKWVDRDGAQEAVSALIEDICIRHRFEDCVDIPENFQHVVTFQLPETLRNSYYDVMERDALITLRSQKTITATTAATVATKLSQIASGAVYDNDGSALVLDTGRYELIADLIEARKQCVVFFLWSHQRDQLVEEFKSRGITFGVIDGDASDRSRDQTVDYFQKGLLRVILAHPKSAAHGLTLTKGTATIWASPTYDAEWLLQGNRRIYRSGQTEKTETITIIAEGTIDERVLEVQRCKQLNMFSLMELLCQTTTAESASPQQNLLSSDSAQTATENTELNS